jgi:hypothetical protein
MTYHWICIKSCTTGYTCEAGTTYPSGAHEFTPGGILSDLTFKIVPFSHIFKASGGFWKTVRPIMFFEKSTD